MIGGDRGATGVGLLQRPTQVCDTNIPGDYDHAKRYQRDQNQPGLGRS